MLKIGEFSKLSRISIRMLRHYDELGLLTPTQIEPSTGYRYYSETQLPLANRITALKEMGFRLSVISSLLEHYDDPKALQEFLKLKYMELKEEEEETKRRLLLLENTMKQIEKDGNRMNIDVTLKELPARYVASVRQIIPAYDKEQLLWTTLMQETATKALQPADPCYTMAIFHDKEYKESDVDVEIQMALRGTYENTEHVTFKHVEPILIASATYQGSYDRVSQVNEAVANWVNDNGYTFDGVSFCIYHVSPHETSNPEEWVTEVCYPVLRK